MAEYISRKTAIAYIREQSEECQKAFEELGGESGVYADAYNDLAEDFYRIPAADVAPVVHGRWKWDTADIYRCTACGKRAHVKEVMNMPVWDYCPNCGARIDGGEADGQKV